MSLWPNTVVDVKLELNPKISSFSLPLAFTPRNIEREGDRSVYMMIYLVRIRERERVVQCGVDPSTLPRTNNHLNNLKNHSRLRDPPFVTPHPSWHTPFPSHILLIGVVGGKTDMGHILTSLLTYFLLIPISLLDRDTLYRIASKYAMHTLKSSPS